MLDISSPGSPQLAGYKSLDSNWMITGMHVSSGDIFYSWKYDIVISRFRKVDSIPLIAISRDSVNIAGVTNTKVTQSQEVWVNAPDSASWSVKADKSWIEYSRNTSSGKLTIEARLYYLVPGAYTGTLTVYNSYSIFDYRTITVNLQVYDNNQTTAPFGQMATPTQGGTASGSSFINWGWALTPQPNIIPTDGSTINVWVDGVNIGHPTYNIYREDIAALLPGYANSSGAGGYFQLDTAKYQNGVHTIQWTVTDSAGNTDGVGSRYFTIVNSGSSRTTVSQQTYSTTTEGMPPQLSQFQVNLIDPVPMKKGFDKTRPFEKVYADESGYYIMETAELEPVEIVFPGTCRVHWGFDVSGNVLKPLPIGSTLDSNNNKFLWHPGPGFVGEYSLVFMEEYENGRQLLKKIIIRITPR